jgi:ring-1,2-phenylacetyl-CoA epoxidase subunit PaaA
MEESFHLRYGYDNVVTLATGTPKQREMVQEALNRWWQPIMHFFGPPDKASVHSEILMRWKVKMASNDDMRQQFFNQYVPKILELIKGNGPCNKERLAVRRMAEEQGAWVRRALKKTNAYTVPLS